MSFVADLLLVWTADGVTFFAPAFFTGGFFTFTGFTGGFFTVVFFAEVFFFTGVVFFVFFVTLGSTTASSSIATTSRRATRMVG